MNTKKTFDAVAESRRWKESVARQTAGMNRTEVLEFFNGARIASSQPHDTSDKPCVVREEPPKP